MSHILHEIAERIELMPPMPGVVQPVKTASPLALGTGMDFSAGAGLSAGSTTSQALTVPVHEGGTDRTRWSTFNEAAGHYIHCARRGDMSIEKAAHLTHGWMNTIMVPPWSEAKFAAEWLGLLSHDVAARGPIAAALPQVIPGPSREPLGTEERALRAWDVGAWTMHEPPPRRFLVAGLVQDGVVHTLAAESGAGKTFLCLELGLRMAAAGNGLSTPWLGAELTAHNAGGTVVMLTAEDDMRELHIRLRDLDPTGALRKAATGRFRPVPLINAGGAFPLVTRKGQEPEPSRRWRLMLTMLKQIVEDGGRISAVIIDTLAATLHGEENKADIVTEYYTEAGRLCGEFGCAVVVTHHVRKGNADKPISSVDEMKAAIRGSGAVLGSSRVVWGAWHAHDYWSRLRMLGEKPAVGRCYRFAVVKANNPEMDATLRTLLRSPNGFLQDVTGKVGHLEESSKIRQLAWLEHAIGVAALDRHPFSKTSLTHGLWARRTEMPDDLHKVGKKTFSVLVDELMAAGRIVMGKLAAGGDGFLDCPGGPVADKQGYRDAGGMKVNWDRWYYNASTGEIRKK